MDDVTVVFDDVTRVTDDVIRAVDKVTPVLDDVTRVVDGITRVVDDVTRAVDDVTRVVCDNGGEESLGNTSCRAAGDRPDDVTRPELLGSGTLLGSFNTLSETFTVFVWA